MLAQGKFPVWDTCEIPLLELSMYLVIVNPSTCQSLQGCHCTPNSEVVSTKLCLYPSPSTTLLTWFQGLLIYISVRSRPLLLSPRKWEMHELHDFLSLQVLLTNTGRTDIVIFLFFFSPPNVFLTWTTGGKGSYWMKFHQQRNLTWLSKALWDQCSVWIETRWFFNFCIYKGDSSGQSKQSCDQSCFCSHPVPWVMNTYHTKSSQSVCPGRLYYLYLCNTL